MAAKRKRATGLPVCAGCSHKWGRHSGGIGSCSECPCPSYDDGSKARARERQKADAEANKARAARWAAMTDEERHAEYRRVTDEIDRLLRALRPGHQRSEALASLGLTEGASRDEVVRAFRSHAMKMHPDHGGDAEAFKALIRARDAALAALKG